MISKKLIREVPEAKSHIIRNVIYQIISLLNNILIISLIGSMIHELYIGEAHVEAMVRKVIILVIAIAIRFLATFLAARESHLAAKSVKSILRNKIYRKMLRIGNGYTKKMSTAEVVQIAVEGVEQLETYFGSYLPQFFYAMIAPIILFVAVAFINLKIAIILLCCVPMIPISIVAVQKFAKKLLQKYWGEYTQLGDGFLENLQGLSTLKIYSADEYKHKQMNEQAERFRKITMRVLTMQLNSISVMDIIAYGGTALGVGCAVVACKSMTITFAEAVVIILLCSDFFLPMRLLGSFFHIAMNGMAASKKMFTLLEMEVEEEKNLTIEETDIRIRNLGYSYEDGEQVIRGVDMDISSRSMISIVGESGCGKSTIAGIIAGTNRGYSGNVTIGGKELSEINQENLLEHITVIGLGSYIFKGSVRDHLLMGNEEASDQMMWEALEKVNMKSFLEEQEGLSTILMERGENFSGGQCQRLALARALLHDSKIYIFDEATSNIDVESENEIMELISKLRQSKTVVLISHRLANVVNSDYIYVMDKGILRGEGTHEDLLECSGQYEKLWNAQVDLENVRKGDSYGA